MKGARMPNKPGSPPWRSSGFSAGGTRLLAARRRELERRECDVKGFMVWVRRRAVGVEIVRQGVLIVIAIAGFVAAEASGVQDLHLWWPFMLVAWLALSAGLYAAAHDIDLTHALASLKQIGLAITVGVLFKAAVVAIGMTLIFRARDLLPLGVVVAQIDPVSVAAIEQGRMSPRARQLLHAWASFDDPVTVVLVWLIKGAGAAGAAVYLFGLHLNLVLAGAALLAFWGLRRRLRERYAARAVGLFTVAAGGALQSMLAVAVTGLGVRGFTKAQLKSASILALGIAAAAVGGVAAGEPLGWDGVVQGTTLGGLAFVAQIPAALVLTRGYEREDRWKLAFGQRLGLTALLLSVTVVDAGAVVAVAVLTCNAIHTIANTTWDHRSTLGRRLAAEPTTS
jgi:hypothetical protein